MSEWAVALRLQTRKLIDGVTPFPVGGILPLKNIDGYSAYLKQADLHNGQIILYDSETRLATCYQSAGELFDAGWVADLQSNLQIRLLAETEALTKLYEVPATVTNLSLQSATTESNKVVPLKACRAKDRA